MFHVIISFVAVIAALYYLVHQHFTKVFQYWKNINVVGPEPSFPFGNVTDVAKRTQSMRSSVTKFYFNYPEEKFIGIFKGAQPMLIVKDLDHINRVMIKDFDNFRNRNLSLDRTILSENLYDALDDKWRLLRQKMTPIFTTSKVKDMFPLMQESVTQFHRYLHQLASRGREVEMQHTMEIFTIQLFTSCILGIGLDVINDEDNDFKDIAKTIFSPRKTPAYCSLMDLLFPGVIRKLNIQQQSEKVKQFFYKIVKQATKERTGKTAGRKDFIDLLIEMKQQGRIVGQGIYENKRIEVEITEMFMTAQLILLYAGGFKTSAHTMSYLLFELAKNQDMQDRVHKEICSVLEKNDGLLTYDGLREMKYLEMLLCETLRMYLGATHGGLIRETASNYTFPNTNVTVEKGIKLIIPVPALHTDPKYFPDPESFVPERFSEENKAEIPQHAYMPFGDGPRHCIAERFARTQIKVGVAGFLQKYKVVPCVRTEEKLTFNPVSMVLTSHGVWLDIVAR